jgi:drug/metabolite transporter (DMT)-like permease
VSPAAAKRDHSVGVALTLLSAVTFGASGVLAKVAYAGGVGVSTLLVGRFTLAAVVLWALVAWRRPALPPLRIALAALLLGAVGYAGEATLYFSALTRLDASMVAMLLATYPVLVVAAAVALGRERPDRRRALALATAIAGAALVLGGAQVGALSGPGLMFAASATVAYASYVLMADRFVARVDGLVLATLVITGAALGTSAFGIATGHLSAAALQPSGWMAIGLLALICTVVPIAAFLLALPRIGPGTASILSTFETVVGVGLAALLLGESLDALQAAGAAMVVGSVIALQLAAPTRVRSDDAAAGPAAPSAARALAEQPA